VAAVRRKKEFMQEYEEEEKAMKTLFRIILFSAVLGIVAYSSLCGADDQWKYVSANDQGERYFYQPDSVIRRGLDVVDFKMMVIHSDASKTMSDSEINCRFKIIRELRTKTERINRPPVFSNFPSEWRGIDLQSYSGKRLTTPEAELYRALCR
jgi:hypothetical protein